MSLRDFQLLGLALLLVSLPLPGFVVLALIFLLLLGQVGALVLAFYANPPQPDHVRLLGGLQDSVLLLAILLAKVCWREGNPFPFEASGPLCWLLAVAGNGIYLHWMLHHALAHQQMQQDYASHIAERLAQVEDDLKIGLYCPDSAQRKSDQILVDQEMLNSICALGRQAGGMALLQLACLAVASAFQPSATVWVGWMLGIGLSGLINSKAQDFSLNYYLPKESRLC